MAWQKPANFNEWLNIVFRHKKKFFFPSVVVATVVVFGLNHYSPRRYSANGTFQRYYDLTMETTASPTIRRSAAPFLRTLYHDLRSRDAVKQVLIDLGLDRDMPHQSNGELTAEGEREMRKVVDEIRGGIYVRHGLRSSSISRITVTFTTPDRDLAAKFVNRLIENYIKQTRVRMNESLDSARQFYEDEVKRYRAKFAELEEKKINFEIKHKGFLPQNPVNVQNQLVDIRAKLQQVEQKLSLALAEKEKLSEWVLQQPEFVEKDMISQNPALTSLMEQLSRLQQELDEHKYRWGRTEEHPMVKKVREQIEKTQNDIARTEKEVKVGTEREPNTARLVAEQQVQTLTGQIQALQRHREQLADKHETWEELNRNFIVIRGQYQQLERQLSETKSQLHFWEDNARRTNIALRTETSQRGIRLSFIEPAPESEKLKPSDPKLRAILLKAVVAGLGVGAVLVVLAELFDHTYHTVDQVVDTLKLPVLGAVNEIVTPGAARRRKMMAWGVFPTVTVALLLVLGGCVFITWLSLNQPDRFEQLRDNPSNFVQEIVQRN